MGPDGPGSAAGAGEVSAISTGMELSQITLDVVSCLFLVTVVEEVRPEDSRSRGQVDQEAFFSRIVGRIGEVGLLFAQVLIVPMEILPRQREAGQIDIRDVARIP